MKNLKTLINTNSAIYFNKIGLLYLEKLNMVLLYQVKQHIRWAQAQLNQ